MKKRNLTFAFAVLFIAILGLANNVFSAQDIYVKTPSDYEGPFYPVIRQLDEDNDLLHVADQPEAAKGAILNLSGVVLNTQGQPQKGVIVEIWQTDPSGKYKDSRDSTPGKRDPNFQYWGKATTAADGTFFFKTLVPGGYAPRPTHIHYKVWVDSEVRLTSQIYLKNHPDRSEFAPARLPASDIQTIELRSKRPNEFEGFFQIII
jgi:protocatechuate 3,4-dioxygenase beta subunit